MNRRGFIKSLLATAVSAQIPINVDKFLISSMNLNDEEFKFKANSLYGIPYHQSNAATNEWLGFKRERTL